MEKLAKEHLVVLKEAVDFLHAGISPDKGHRRVLAEAINAALVVLESLAKTAELREQLRVAREVIDRLTYYVSECGRVNCPCDQCRIFEIVSEALARLDASKSTD